MIKIDHTLKNRVSTALSGQTVQLLSTRTNVTIFDWLTKSPIAEKVLESPLLQKYKNTYGDISEDTIVNVLTAKNESNEILLIPIDDVNGFVNGSATQTTSR